MKYSKQHVAGVVIIYNSEPNIIDNIASYIDQIDKLFIVDNSEKPDHRIEQLVSMTFPNARYTANDGNMGVAFALNIAAQMAIREGYHFLLTMDDDSKASGELVGQMLAFVAQLDLEKIGIISVNHSIRNWHLPFKPVLYTMTSGNLLSLNAYQVIGPYMNELFIDHVDHEYGLRLNARGFQVVELTDVTMQHKLGSQKQVMLLGKSLRFVSHSPLRTYYMSRNGIYVAKRYYKIFPRFAIDVIGLTLKEFAKAVLFEDLKRQRLKAIRQGIADGFFNKLGKKRH